LKPRTFFLVSFYDVKAFAQILPFGDYTYSLPLGSRADKAPEGGAGKKETFGGCCSGKRDSKTSRAGPYACRSDKKE
jgi:hypothetical protein